MEECLNVDVKKGSHPVGDPIPRHVGPDGESGKDLLKVSRQH